MNIEVSHLPSTLILKEKPFQQKNNIYSFAPEDHNFTSTTAIFCRCFLSIVLLLFVYYFCQIENGH